MGGFDRPKGFGVCFVKNEEDIIADSVAHAARFCDKLFVVDNATTDQTWDIVNGLELDNLVPVFSRDFIFRDYLPSQVHGCQKGGTRAQQLVVYLRCR